MRAAQAPAPLPKPVFDGRLAILAGRGAFPLAVAHAAGEFPHSPFVFALKGEADQDWSEFDHAWISIGDLSSFMAIVRREAIGAVVLAGGVAKRPDWKDVRPTWASVKAAPSAIAALLFGGDDKILRVAINALENNGVCVLAAHHVAPDLLGQSGPLGKHRPGRSDQRDIAAAAQAALALGQLDIGQGAVSVGGRVIALEGLEGTDAMLARVAGLRAERRLRASTRGVLVKMCKPDQDHRADLPSIGPDTIANAHAAGLAGIAIEAGRSLVLDRARVRSESDRLGLFVTGLNLFDMEPSQ